jgi:hypothetical protein
MTSVLPTLQRRLCCELHKPCLQPRCATLLLRMILLTCRASTLPASCPPQDSGGDLLQLHASNIGIVGEQLPYLPICIELSSGPVPLLRQVLSPDSDFAFVMSQHFSSTVLRHMKLAFLLVLGMM